MTSTLRTFIIISHATRCYLDFLRILRVGSTKASNIEENYVLDEFFTSIQLNVIRDENAYLLTQLLSDWLRLCNERRISSLITP